MILLPRMEYGSLNRMGYSEEALKEVTFYSKETGMMSILFLEQDPAILILCLLLLSVLILDFRFEEQSFDWMTLFKDDFLISHVR